jgi:thymidine phosphorylase
VLEFDAGLRGGAGRARAENLLDSGAALSAMERIIELQGEPPTNACLGTKISEICATKAGAVTLLDCHRLARIARAAGAPMDKGAGIDLLVKSGASVKVGDPLYRIHSCFQSDFEFAKIMAEEDAGVVVDGDIKKSGAD